MRKLIFFDVHGDEARSFKRALRNVFGVQLECTSEPLNQLTVKKYADAQLVSVFVTSEVDAEVMKQLPELELIATRSTGYDHIDLAAAKAHQVLVSHVPDYGETTVAEFTFMLLLGLVRKLSIATEQVHSGVIDHTELTGYDLAGKTLGLIGCGRIGRHVAKIASGFDMNVIGYDPYPATSADLKFVELNEVLETAEVISLHAPLSKQTKHILDKKALGRTRPGVVIINTARGELIDTGALIDGLYSGHIGGAGLDVLEDEQLLRFEEEIALLHPGVSTHDLLLSAEQKILLRLSNVIVTPHNAFNSVEALKRIRVTTTENIKKYLMHEPQNLIK